MADGPDYVHGYKARVSERLLDQAHTLAELLHPDTDYPAGVTVLEPGCGVGGQSAIFNLPFRAEAFDHVFIFAARSTPSSITRLTVT